MENSRKQLKKYFEHYSRYNEILSGGNNILDGPVHSIILSTWEFDKSIVVYSTSISKSGSSNFDKECVEESLSLTCFENQKDSDGISYINNKKLRKLDLFLWMINSL